MEPVYTEIEFAHEKYMNGPFYQALKMVPSAVLYRTRCETGERLAILLFNDRSLKAVHAVAKKFTMEVYATNDVNHDQMMAICTGESTEFIDGYDTRDQRFWLGQHLFDYRTETGEKASG